MKHLGIILFITFIFTSHYITSSYVNTNYKKIEKEKIIEEVVLKPLNTKNLLEELKKHNVKHPEIVLRQSIMESGWFKCTSCSMRYNNPFGFRYPSWVDKDNPLGYLKFDTWQDAVKYYKKWQKKRYKGGDYYEFLKNIGYAQDPNYIKKLKSISI